MQRSRSALVVAATPTLATQLCAWLKRAGWNVVSSNSYRAAKAQLDLGIDLLVAELELGDYNGLQLALRAQSNDIAAVVIGRADVVLERDAEQLGCSYLRKEELDEHRLAIAAEAQAEVRRVAVPARSRNIQFARRSFAAARQGTTTRRMLLH